MSMTQRLINADKNKLTMPEKQVEMVRLSEQLEEGGPAYFTLKGITSKKLESLREDATNIIKDGEELDGKEFVTSLLIEGIIEPSFKDKELQKFLGVKSAKDAITELLTDAEQMELAEHIQKLSGFGVENVREVVKKK
jgi:hypothetical protein